MNKNGRGPGKAGRKAKAIAAVAMAMDGKTNPEIGAELGMSRNGVSKLLNSSETKEILKGAEDRITRLIEKACGVVDKSMDDSSIERDMSNGLKAALAVLKSVGVIKDKVDISHTFPKPTVIKRLNGEEVVLGTTADRKEES